MMLRYKKSSQGWHFNLQKCPHVSRRSQLFMQIIRNCILIIVSIYLIDSLIYKHYLMHLTLALSIWRSAI